MSADAAVEALPAVTALQLGSCVIAARSDLFADTGRQ
jgi:hypothetical protein